jgi:hypothetical protein
VRKRSQRQPNLWGQKALDQANQASGEFCVKKGRAQGNARVSGAKPDGDKRGRCVMPNETEIIPLNPLADGDREERISQRAYQLWEEDGAPEGRAEEYSHRARELIEQEERAKSPPYSSGVLR